MISSIILVFTSITVASSQNYSACDIYNQLEATSGCGSNGYALQYGLPNCKRFTDNEWMYNTAGKTWLECTRTCLANFIANNIIAANITNCTAISDAAFSSHVPCYVNCGFCNAALTNILPLALTYSIGDFLSLTALQQILQIIVSCLSHPLQLLVVTDMMSADQPMWKEVRLPADPPMTKLLAERIRIIYSFMIYRDIRVRDHDIDSDVGRCDQYDTAITKIREMESLSALERLPSDLMLQLIEYASETVFHMRTTSSVMRARVDQYARQRSYLPVVKVLLLGKEENSSIRFQYTASSGEESENVFITMSVPKHLSNLLELRFKYRQDLIDLFPAIERRSDYTHGYNFNYCLKLDVAEMEHFECLKEFLGRSLERVIVFSGCSIPLLNVVAKLVEKHEICQLEVYLNTLSDEAFNCMKTFNARALLMSVSEVEPNADPIKFLIDVSSKVSAICIIQRFVEKIPENSRFFFGVNDIDWPRVFLKMFSSKLDKLYVRNHSFRNYLSRDGLDKLKHDLPLNLPLGKKIWLTVCCSGNANAIWYKDNDHYVFEEADFLRIKHASRYFEQHEFF